MIMVVLWKVWEMEEKSLHENTFPWLCNKFRNKKLHAIKSL